jgi:hypothetical protein
VLPLVLTTRKQPFFLGDFLQLIYWQPKRVVMKKFVVTLQIFFSHPSLVIYFFATPPIKLKLGQQICGELLIANHLDQLLWWAIQKHWAKVRSHLLHSLRQVHGVLAPFTSHHEISNFVQLKPFSWTKSSCFNFFSSNCIVHDHMLNTPRDALSSRKRPKTKFYFGHVKIVNMFFSVIMIPIKKAYEQNWTLGVPSSHN